MLLQNLLYLFRPDIHQWFLQKSRLKSKTLIGFKSFMFILFMRQIFFIPANEIKGSSKGSKGKTESAGTAKNAFVPPQSKTFINWLEIFFSKSNGAGWNKGSPPITSS